MTQTATDWLFEKLWTTPIDKFTWNALLKEANEMHEQQIIDAHMHGHNAPSSTLKNFDAELYYNETFKKD
jgi:hypothetical protein